MRWMGRQAVVTLPEHIDRSNAGPVREQLLWVINRGAVVLIADLAATVSYDYSGADALARAYQRAVASRTELRLVVTAGVIRRVFSLSGLDRLVSVYPAVGAAIAAGAGRGEVPGQPAAAAIPLAGPGPADRSGELLDWVVATIFHVGMSLQAASDLPRDATAKSIREALGRLDDLVLLIRYHMFTGPGEIQPGPARTPPPDPHERLAQARDRAALLRQRVTRTAHALQSAAADTAALLEQRADLLDQPRRIDYPSEIKRWQVLADQAGRLAERWEQQL